MRSGLGLAPLLLLASVSAAGQQVEITPGDCRTGVHLVARNAPLADVLKRLAQTLDFQLRFEGDPERVVTANTTRAPVELVSMLSPQDSIIVTQARDPRCPGRNRIVKVWVLPQGKPASAREASAPATAARAAQPVDQAVRSRAAEVVIGPSAELEEQSRRAKKAYEEYVRVHGKPPPGVAEDAAKP